MCEDRRQEGSKMCFTLGAPTSRNVMYKSKGKGKSPARHDKEEDVRGRTWNIGSRKNDNENE